MKLKYFIASLGFATLFCVESPVVQADSASYVQEPVFQMARLGNPFGSGFGSRNKRSRGGNDQFEQQRPSKSARGGGWGRVRGHVRQNRSARAMSGGRYNSRAGYSHRGAAGPTRGQKFKAGLTKFGNSSFGQAAKGLGGSLLGGLVSGVTGQQPGGIGGALRSGLGAATGMDCSKQSVLKNPQRCFAELRPEVEQFYNNECFSGNCDQLEEVCTTAGDFLGEQYDSSQCESSGGGGGYGDDDSGGGGYGDDDSDGGGYGDDDGGGDEDDGGGYGDDDGGGDDSDGGGYDDEGGDEGFGDN